VMPFPGGVGISGLRVYDWPTVDGLCGGSPHVHLTCAECYYVIGGEGSVQTLTSRGFASTPLREGTVAWFTPGTIHRLVNDGDLRIIVVMQNSGLPEAGDAVFTFPPPVLADAQSYAARAQAGDAESAQLRRDLALEGFLELRPHVEAGEVAALEDFYRSAVRLKQDVLDSWEKRWREGALASAERTGGHPRDARGGAAAVRHVRATRRPRSRRGPVSARLKSLVLLRRGSRERVRAGGSDPFFRAGFWENRMATKSAAGRGNRADRSGAQAAGQQRAGRRGHQDRHRRDPQTVPPRRPSQPGQHSGRHGGAGFERLHRPLGGHAGQETRRAREPAHLVFALWARGEVTFVGLPVVGGQRAQHVGDVPLVERAHHRPVTPFSSNASRNARRP
jgi:mannose-6-phosphate isomerase-like protein (cupin superfamily)